jgi:type IX secretion system PorP/SprF family membrane protein
MNKKLIILGFLVSLGSFTTQAQQDPMLTHYMYNTSSVNPAYAGSREALSISVLNRFQWVGIEGAPMTNMINVNTPILKKNIGVGLTVMKDKLGPMNKTSINADFAYRLKLNKTSRLNFGLKGGVDMVNANLASLILTNQNDPILASNIQRLRPNFGFGLLFQSDRFYIGVSTPRLLEYDFGTSQGTANVNFLLQRRHYYGIAGAALKMGPQVVFKPTTLLKLSPGAKPQIDLTASFIFNNTLTLGLMGRSNDAFGVLVGFNISEQFNIGYSFDYSSFNRVASVNSGSHELMLRYELIHTKDSKIKSPRYF